MKGSVALKVVVRSELSLDPLFRFTYQFNRTLRGERASN